MLPIFLTRVSLWDRLNVVAKKVTLIGFLFRSLCIFFQIDDALKNGQRGEADGLF